MYSHRDLREAFHFLFLERLLKTMKPNSVALKGGVNLRFFFQSPRYSEDMDLDTVGVPVHSLREKGYQLLEDKSLRRSLEVYGIRELRVNSPEKAKHTETTQRFRLRLLNLAGEELPTKIEFSRRRETMEDAVVEPVNPEIARRYQRLAYLCPHYPGNCAVLQKLRALANRKAPQARDLFDLYILHLGGHFSETAPLTPSERESARENLLAFSFNDFRDQVLQYLDEGERSQYESEKRWQGIQEKILSLLMNHD